MTSTEEFNCLFCNDSFDSKEELQVHFRKHGDPKFNQSVKNSKGKGQSEMASCGEKGEEGETVKCDVCEEVFPTISKAITHKHKVHPDHDAKYFCPWCGKLFTMKHLYNKHIESTHESREQSDKTGFHCDYCEADFFVASAMVYHNKFFHRQDTELAAIGHSKKLKMYNQELLQIYYCPFCGEEYSNKVNLHKHMGDDHIDENQSPEDVLRCPLCDAVFYHLDAYELHLTFHSTEDMYSEDSEMLKQITEFSLETVSPIMEKVENESQEDDPAESRGIEELLQQAMNESNDNTNDSTGRVKKKKHKKHKKSKKAAITLDEFLNMNSDVFGEGLDFQGIEEIPTQVVAKQLKRKPAMKMKPDRKPKPPTELQKLKQAGIVVKKKTMPFQGIKIINRQPNLKSVQIAQNIDKVKHLVQIKPKATVSSDDALSRLLSQNNKQIKIVKKSKLDIPFAEILSTDNGPLENTSDVNKKPANEEVGQDILNKLDEYKSTEVKSQEINRESEHDNEISKSQDNSQGFSHSSANSSANICQEIKESPVSEGKNEPFSHNRNLKETNNIQNKCLETTNTTENALNALRNISQHLTIKPVSPNNVSSNRKTPVKEIDKDEDRIDQTDQSVIDTDNNKNSQRDSSNNTETLEPTKSNSNQKSLNAIKHLSHLLTVKSVGQSIKMASPTISKEDIIEKTDSDEEIPAEDFDDENDTEINKEIKKENISTSKQIKTDIQNQSSKLDALKNLSKHITIKSLAQNPNSCNVIEKSDKDETEEFEHEDDEFEENENKRQAESGNKSNILLNKQIFTKTITNRTNQEIFKSNSPINSEKIINKIQLPNETIKDEDAKTCVNILKQYPNITAKPASVAKDVRQNRVQSSTQSVNLQKGNISRNCMKKIETKHEEIEIFNIDDSDDEDTIPPVSVKTRPYNISTTVNTSKDCESNVSNKSRDVLKNLGKHITIKSNQEKPKKNTQISNEIFQDEAPTNESDDDFDFALPENKQVNQGNTVIENKLKSLSNITVKSQNSSPKIPTATIKTNNKQIDEYDSDEDTGNITELPNSYNSDDDVPLQKACSTQLNKVASVQKANDILTDNEADFDDDGNDDKDIESQIKPNLLRKSTPDSGNNSKLAFLNSLKNLTVKSLKENKVDHDDEDAPDNNPEEKAIVPYVNNELAQKPLRQTKTVSQGESQSSSNKHIKQNIGAAMNQNIATSSNQVNTIVKQEVQTFQTKTIIQEITTTVTKTIRTVNQAVKQEVRSVVHNTSTPIRPHTIQAMRPTQQIRNFQGAPVRPTAPTMGPRMRKPMIPTRAPGPNIRPSNQLVPVRSGVNVARLSNPRMPVIRKPPQPSTSSSLSPTTVGKPLKISPNAILPSSKRPAFKEASGPFSCFKKPKESLIPGSDVADFNNEKDSAVHFASSSHMTQSNFTSTTKTMKGNSLVTSTQIKSAVSSSSEQVNRLNSMSGLKVVKTSQVKQASKVEEKTEVSASKRTALDAIEKLQRQGLLVKKPRIEEPDDSDHSNPADEGDDYYDT